ncbi:MAG: ABC-F family ATP-binding cassette domain-containing protein [Bacteroidota bacterium]|nr:ABC-F family ATP-binding cassette domain-containing protein [Bacteroidota bacterium]
MISVNRLTLDFGSFRLFKDVSFLINKKDRIGLVGKNGAGKSSLLKIITSELSPSSGEISFPENMQIGYLPQDMQCVDKRDLFAETELAFSEILQLEKNIVKFNTELAERDDYESEGYHKLIQKLSEANERHHILGGTSKDAAIEQTLLGLGFLKSDFNRQTSEFSGGWRMRIELAKILLRKPDVLLLDEPTNHLDIEAIQWFEDFLKTYKGAVLLISHDKAFLDNVTNRTVEILLGRIHDYNANYSKYVVLRKERREQQIAAFKNQQKTIAETEEFIEKFRYKATKAVQVQSRIKQLEKIDRIEIDDEDNSVFNLRFPPAPRSGDISVEMKELSKSYGELNVLQNIDLTVNRGEKIAFVGKNGEGKTTLSKVIIGQLKHTGNLKVGHNVDIGYYAQNQDELLNENKTVFQTIDDIATGDIRTKIRDILGSFLFKGEDIDKKVNVLSGGERARLALAKLLLHPYNLLILDEPTNHLDMLSKDVLKKALKDFEGTIILVSHDREFLDGLVDIVYEFRNKKVKQHIGGIYNFLKKRKLENLKELEKKSLIKQAKKDTVASDNKNSYLERKEYDKKIRKVEKEVEQAEKKINKLETEIDKMNELMTNPENLKNDSSLFENYENLKINLNKEMEKWEQLNEKVDLLKEQRN